MPLIHQRQDGGGAHELVRAAHGEALISAVARTQELLGWRPTRQPGLISDLEALGTTN